MLVFSREKEQCVVLYNDKITIKVKVIETGRDKIKLGFEAPDDITIDREEIYKAKQATIAGR